MQAESASDLLCLSLLPTLINLSQIHSQRFDPSRYIQICFSHFSRFCPLSEDFHQQVHITIGYSDNLSSFRFFCLFEGQYLEVQDLSFSCAALISFQNILDAFIEEWLLFNKEGMKLCYFQRRKQILRANVAY